MSSSLSCPIRPIHVTLTLAGWHWVDMSPSPHTHASLLFIILFLVPRCLSEPPPAAHRLHSHTPSRFALPPISVLSPSEDLSATARLIPSPSPSVTNADLMNLFDSASYQNA
jgi:hypothetical protein